MIELLDTKTSVKPAEENDEFVLQQLTTVKVEDDVRLSKTAKIAGQVQADIAQAKAKKKKRAKA